ncbi:MAG: hypothetical protein WC829_22510 [Hyphomicrobium sp.]|jgi:hypothetical protein
MVVAVIAVRMMEVAVDKIVDVIAVRHSLVTAARSVYVADLVPLALELRGAAIRVLLRDFNHMLVDMIDMRMVQMPVVQIVDMIAVLHCRMAATGTMFVRMIGVMWF